MQCIEVWCIVLHKSQQARAAVPHTLNVLHLQKSEVYGYHFGFFLLLSSTKRQCIRTQFPNVIRTLMIIIIIIIVCQRCWTLPGTGASLEKINIIRTRSFLRAVDS